METTGRYLLSETAIISPSSTTGEHTVSVRILIVLSIGSMSAPFPEQNPHQTPAHQTCPVPYNRQHGLPCGGPGVGTCYSGLCTCEPHYSGPDCSNCSSMHQPRPAPEWGATATFCASSTASTVAVAQIPVHPDADATGSANDAEGMSATVTVLAVAVAIVIAMTVVLLVLLRKQRLGQSHLPESSECSDPMRAEVNESRASGQRQPCTSDTLSVCCSGDSVIADMGNVMCDNPLAGQPADSPICRQYNTEVRACAVRIQLPQHRPSLSDSAQCARTPRTPGSTAGLGSRSTSVTLRSNSNQVPWGDSPRTRGITWVHSVRAPLLSPFVSFRLTCPA